VRQRQPHSFPGRSDSVEKQTQVFYHSGEVLKSASKLK